MRRVLCAAVLSSALLLGACSTDKSADTPAAATPAASVPAGTPTSGGSSAPAPRSSAAGKGDAALKGNTKAICDQAAKTGGDAAKNFAQDLKLLIDAESAQDKAAVAAAKAKTTRDVENYSFALGDMAKLASEPQLKKALGAMSKQVSALKGDVRKLDAEKLDGLQETLSKACGTD
ncbi:hypothetical protein [Nucisporomicrobium flavum]|uniref:hypothetical protein n=1 Tax=Nucisporomicrobium flavum TaxID=2785915 RepID=UPI0018F4E2B4|nr:hypothetical protein [Nucisporomicrobium flavum]